MPTTRASSRRTKDHQSDEEFKALFERSPIAKLRYDAAGYPTEMNDAAVALIGVPNASAIAHISLFSTPRISDANKQRLHQGEAICYTHRYDFDDIRKSGHFPTTRSGARYLDVHIIPLFADEGDIKGYIGEFFDVTDRNRTKEERENTAKFAEENPYLIFRLTLEGAVLYTNAAGEALFKSRLFSLDNLRESAAQAYALGKEDTIEVTDGTHTFQLTCVPIVDKGYVNVYGMDVSKRKRAEGALQQAHEEVQSLNEELQSANEELRVANQTLEQRVQERTEELASANEELNVTNEELRREIAHRTRAENAALVHAHRTAILNEITHVLNEAGDLPTLYERVLTQTITRLGFDRGLIGFETDAGHFTVRSCHNIAPQLIDVAKCASLDDNIVARTLFLKQKLVVYDETPPDMPAYRDGLRGAFVGIPFLSQGDTVGCILLNSDERRSFTRDDRALFQAVGREFGTAVAKLQAKEQLSWEVRVNSAIVRLSASLLSRTSDPEATSIAILNEAKHLTGSRHGFMELLDPTTKDMIAYGHTEMMLDECAIAPEERQIRFSIGPDGKYHALSTHAINEKKGFFTNAPAEHPASTGAPEGHVVLEQFLAAPALIGDEAVGEIALANPGREYTQRDVVAVEQLAGLYALVVMRMWADEQLRASSLYARNLVEASLDPLVTISAEGIITDVNKATEDLTGFSRDKLIGSDFSDYFTEPERARRGYEQVFANGLVKDYPLRIRHKSGILTDVLYNATVYRNEAGEVQGVFAAARDVTERKRAEAAAQEYAHRQEVTNSVIKAGNEAADLQSAITSMLDHVVSLTGFEAGAVYLLDTENNVSELQYASDSEAEMEPKRIARTNSHIARVYEGVPSFVDDHRVFRSPRYHAGSVAIAHIPLSSKGAVIGHYVVSSTTPHYFSESEKELLSVLGQEAGTVIARLQAEEASLQRATMLDRAHDAIVMSDINDRITYWNQGAERLYGWTHDEAIGKNVHALLNTMFSEPLEQIKATLTETGRWGGELVHVTRAGTTVSVVSHTTLQRTPEGIPIATLEINTDITRRKRAEEQAHAASLYARSLIEASLDPLVTISAEGKITDVNKTTEEVTGCSREELIGSDFNNYFTEPEKARTGYKQTFSDGFVRDYPLAIRHKSGRVVDVLYNAAVYRDEGGEVQGVFAAARDITDRKRAEEELQRYSGHLEAIVEERTAQLAQSEEYFRTLFDASSVGQIRFDAESCPIRMNKAAAALLGVSGVDDVKHNTIFTSPSVSEEDKARLRAGQPVRYEHRYDFPAIRESGYYQTTRSDVAYFDVYIRPLLNASGTIEGYLSQYVDITERKEAEAALQASEQQYRTLVETANSIICTVDTAGTITFINDYGAQFFGYTPDELIGQNVMIIIPAVESSGREMTPYIDDIIARPDEHVVSVNENITKDGQRVWINWVNRILTDKEGRHTGHLGIGYDITEQIRAQDALKNAERLAGIGETAAMIGHDLRNPLQGLQYIVDLQKLRSERVPLEKRGVDDWQQEQALFDRISEQVYYMDKIVGDLQDYARPVTPEHEVVKVRILLNDVLQSLPHTDGVEIVIDIPNLTVNADPHLMHRVFANLILNAMQAMPEGGMLTISATADDRSVAIKVHDTGAGIPREMRDKLFSPLTTGKAKGTGLGLAVVKRIVEAHDGTIEFESEEGNGTTFTVTLPQTSSHRQ